ncbi:MAG: tetratricopeptide repeat protein [Pantanalinema sp. GBBB05]|nr:tetratricopeptide repeat protein [Pantanalinema sp. GBBB05]
MGSGVAALSQAAAIAGLGGIGKTQTAIEYAYRYFYDTPIYEWVFWVRADTELNLVTDLAEIGRSLHLGEGNLEELAQQTCHWLQTHPGWLLIFDNADRPELVKPWMPRHPEGRVLLTSRAQGFVKLGIPKPIVVQALSLEDSLWFLFERTDRLPIPAASVVTKTNDPEFIAATALAKELAGLPLALEQAAAYIRRVGVSFQVYWKYYQQQQLQLLEKGLPETGDYPQSVATTWLLNFEEIAQRSPASVPILQLSAVLAADDIPEQLLLVCAEEFGLVESTDQLALAEQLAVLADFSLIQRERETASYSIHQMVQTVIWQRLTSTEQQEWMQRAITGLNAVFPDVTKFENWAVCGQLVPHVQAIATRPEATEIVTPDWAKLLNEAGYYLNQQGRYGEVKPFYQRALQIKLDAYGNEHPDIATSYNNLAALYYSQGHYSEAEPLYRQALELRQRLFGEEHPDVATSYNNLAVLYRSQGRYGEAEPLYRQALELRQRLFGEEHPDVAISYNNLAALYHSQGRYGEAEPLYRQALELRQRLFGEEHPDVAISYNNLALLYALQGRHNEAEPLYRQALELQQRLFGEKHPNVAISYNNLAGLYESQDRYSEAELLYQQAFQIDLKALGADHPDTAISIGNLAGLYTILEQYAEAERLYFQALQVFHTRLGTEHPYTKTTLKNLGNLIIQAYQAGRANEFDHPITQAILQQIQAKDTESSAESATG